MSWSWLERWMATRLQETSSVESHTMKQNENFNSDHKFSIKTRFLDASGEEKESCGSNEVPLHFDNFSMISHEDKVSFKSPTAKTNFKARRSVSRRKTVPSNQFHEEHLKVRIFSLVSQTMHVKPKTYITYVCGIENCFLNYF